MKQDAALATESVFVVPRLASTTRGLCRSFPGNCRRLPRSNEDWAAPDHARSKAFTTRLAGGSFGAQTRV